MCHIFQIFIYKRFETDIYFFHYTITCLSHKHPKKDFKLVAVTWQNVKKSKGQEYFCKTNQSKFICTTHLSSRAM